MDICEISKQEYEQFYTGSEAGFLQSPQWGELKRLDGYFPRYFKYEAGSQGSGGAGAFLGLCKKYPVLGEQAYIPRVKFSSEGFPFIAAALKNRFGIVLIDPDLESDLSNIQNAEGIGIEFSDKTIQPKKTAMIDLSQNEEEWLASCRKSAKERIKAGQKAESAGRLRIKRVTIAENADEVNEVVEKVTTLSEEKFHARKGGYLKRLVEVFGERAVVWRIEAGGAGGGTGKCVGGSIGILSERQKIYHTIYSVTERLALQELNAGYLLKLHQWRFGHEIGYKWLDMWGVETDPNHPWYGFSQFKLGFGAKVVEYPSQVRLFRSALFRASFKLKRG